jgi:hypothetical protein
MNTTSKCCSLFYADHYLYLSLSLSLSYLSAFSIGSNFGKLNFYLGARAAREGRPSRYPTIDFCKTPDAICSSEEYSELKWISGLWYWMDSVQNYNSNGWYYKTELHKFVNGGMTDDSFIDSISGIVNRGCHNPPCATGDVDGLTDRRGNFQSVLSALGLPSTGTKPSSTLPPIPSPTDNLESATASVSKSSLQQILDSLTELRPTIESNVLMYRNAYGVESLSDVYTFNAFIESLAYFAESGIGGKRFYIGSEQGSEQSSSDLRYGMVNVAAFLAQSRTESIQYNACEEFHSDDTSGKFAISNSCGQYGNEYQEMKCTDGLESGMTCPVLTDMRVEALDDGARYFDRPQFYCRPRTDEPFTGYYDARSSQINNDEAFANGSGRTDVEG